MKWKRMTSSGRTVLLIQKLTKAPLLLLRQVEMIRNPALRNVPLGIQQKYIIVTCNYVARERGVTKLMSLTDAKEKCPELVLVKGEDLTHYREMSYKVTDLLMSYCPLVERLGFDENFMDVTEMVEKRLTQTTESNSFSFEGHVYNHTSADVKACDHPRLAVGSHIAAELRRSLHSSLGLTGCAGVATNKLLAKLVSGTFKPNQQTVLLPENTRDIMGCLSSLRKVPGVGHQTAKRLQALGLVSVEDLQLFPLSDLTREFGGATAQRLKNLSLGIDDSPVTTTGAPQSLSDEDSFKKMSSTQEVVEKIQQLLSSLVERMHRDGRQPQTFRLTIRRYSATNKWFSRESRQCPIPNHIGQKITSGCCDDAALQLVPLAMKLFHKMVDSSAAFHLTLINVCFSNLQSRGVAVSGRGSITSFLTQSSSPRKTQTITSQRQSGESLCLDHQFSCHNMMTTDKNQFKKSSSCCSEAELHESRGKRSSTSGKSINETKESDTQRLPPHVDPEVFKLLPVEIQKELLSPAYIKSLSSTNMLQNPAGPVTDSQNIHDLSDGASTVNPPPPHHHHHHHEASGTVSGEEEEQAGPSLPQPPDCQVPGNVDPEVFSELPPDVQRELMSEWKQQKTILKIPSSSSSSRKPGRSSTRKDKKKTAAKSSQNNNLFKYFKPG